LKPDFLQKSIKFYYFCYPYQKKLIYSFKLINTP